MGGRVDVSGTVWSRVRRRLPMTVAEPTVLARLDARVAELEAEVQECRELNLRIAELTDVVVELLAPLGASDDARVAEIVGRYRLEVYSAGATGPDGAADPDGSTDDDTSTGGRSEPGP